jgi:hypothetical protein
MRLRRGDVDVTTANLPVTVDQLAAWCERWLGFPPSNILFATGHLSTVVGVQLPDGRQVVVKARPVPPARADVCAEVQASLSAIGFPCPMPLTGPRPLGALTATAETYLPGGEILPAGAELTVTSARALARLVALTPPARTVPELDPPPPWAWPQHQQGRIWPRPDDLDTDLNAYPGPGWLDALGDRIRHHFAHTATSPYPPVVGHVDWEAQNLRWAGDGSLHAVHDWDSLAIQPEEVIAGLAAAVHTADGRPGTEATTEQAHRFLTSYQQARGRTFTPHEIQTAWAAGLWVRAFNAKKAALDPHTAGPILNRLADEAAERLRIANI